MSYLGRDKIEFNQIKSEKSPSEWLPYGIGIDVHLKFAIVSVAIPNYLTQEVTYYWQKVSTHQRDICEAEIWIASTLTQHNIEPPYNYVIESTSTYHFVFIRHFSAKMRPIIINPTIAGKDKRKSDKYDSQKLSYHCMTGVWKPTPVVTGNQEILRVLTRQRKKMERHRTRLTNSLATRLTQYGITFTQEVRPSSDRSLMVIKEIATLGTKDPEFLSELAGDIGAHHFIAVNELPVDVRFVLSTILDSIKELGEKVDAYTVQINTLIDIYYANDFELLKTLPGIGDKSAQIYLAEVGGHIEITQKFTDSRKVAAFCGVSPDKKTSAGKVTSHLRRGGNIWIKPVLIQCAQTVLRTNTPLAYWGRAIAARSKEGGLKKAVVAVARRLAIAGYQVLKKQEPFDNSQSDYSYAKKSADKMLDKVSREIEAIELSDATAGKASEVAYQLASKVAGMPTYSCFLAKIGFI